MSVKIDKQHRIIIVEGILRKMAKMLNVTTETKKRII